MSRHAAPAEQSGGGVQQGRPPAGAEPGALGEKLLPTGSPSLENTSGPQRVWRPSRSLLCRAHSRAKGAPRGGCWHCACAGPRHEEGRGHTPGVEPERRGLPPGAQPGACSPAPHEAGLHPNKGLCGHIHVGDVTGVRGHHWEMPWRGRCHCGGWANLQTELTVVLH